MKRKLIWAALCVAVLLLAGVAIGQYTTSNYHEQGGARWVIGGSLDVASGGDLDIESGGSLKLAGTALATTAAELNQYVIYGEIADISSAASSWTVAPHAGDIVAIYTVIDGAITDADAAITFELGGTAVTGGAITIANSGSAAGTVDSSTPTALRTVTAGQAIEIITDGGSTDAAKAAVGLVISR